MGTSERPVTQVRIPACHGGAVMLREGQRLKVTAVKGRQICAGAPWVIKVEDVSAFAARKRLPGPVTPNPAQQTFEFQ